MDSSPSPMDASPSDVVGVLGWGGGEGWLLLADLFELTNQPAHSRTLLGVFPYGASFEGCLEEGKTMSLGNSDVSNGEEVVDNQKDQNSKLKNLTIWRRCQPLDMPLLRPSEGPS